MTATAQLCGHPLPRGRVCHARAGHRGLHGAETDPCGYRWPRTVTTRHTCIQPYDHPPPCRCRCGATTTREET